MSGLESDLNESFARGRNNRKSEASGRIGPTTPHRSKRIDLGTPANYYFKYMNSGRKNQNDEILFSKESDEGDTGTISIPGIKLDGGNSKTETSFFSIANSSSGSEASGDMLNKSTLSDTTELTASNFVLVTTSKQNMIRNNRDFSAPVHDKENNSIQKNSITQKESSPLQAKEDYLPSSKMKVGKDYDPNIDHAGGKSVHRFENDNKVVQNLLTKINPPSSHPTANESPSLRSRISSSPASLRKFHENLKNSRMKRQMQREEDTKRRNSIDGKDTLNSMHAQLEALTGDVSVRRERLPPSFTKRSQLSPSQNFSSTGTESSSEESTEDDTATIDMKALDDLLGIKGSTSFNSESNTTSENEEVTNLSLLPDDKKDETENVSTLHEESSIVKNGTNQHNDNTPKHISKASTSFHQNGELMKSTSRQKMTPTKLSPAPQRVVNPQSIFSPARNTRSATKKRKISEQDQDMVSTEHIVKSKRRSSPNRKRLFDMDSLSEKNVSINSDYSDLRSPCGDDTASLGDIANLFGIDKPNDDQSESSMMDHTANERVRLQLESQDTASIGAINDVMNACYDSDKAHSHQNASISSPTRKNKDLKTPSSVSSDITDTFSCAENSKNIQSAGIESTEKRQLNSVLSENTHKNNSDDTDSISLENQENDARLHNAKDLQQLSPRARSSPEKLDGNLRSNIAIPKSPIRLTPNKHTKLTPTKLTASPRRVMNPKSPNSPARNTRSSTKSKLLEETELNLSMGEASKQDSKLVMNNKRKMETTNVEKLSNDSLSMSIKRSKNQSDTSSPNENRHKKSTVGILSSKKKTLPRRSVAFGSPDAAEYNIGSPSVSITPMPKGRAKALFSLPGISNHPNPQHAAVDTNGSSTIDLGTNLLIDKITTDEMQNSPDLSPIVKGKIDTVENEISENTMASLIANNSNTSNDLGSLNSNPSPSESQMEMRDSSIELTDAESIASINSKCKKYTSDFVVPVQAQRLDFSAISETDEKIDTFSNDKKALEVENTVELEGNMLSLLEATNDKKNVEGVDNADEMETTAESVSLILKGDKTESELFTGNLSNIVAESNKQGENTVELEGNMLSLLEATNDKKNVEGADNADEMETTAESVSLILKGDKTESELFTGNLSNIVAESNKQGENTVELEGNMLSLLEAANDKKNVEGVDNADEMETTAESVSLILKGDKTESELFTGNLSNIVAESNKQGENTVELEGNMLSLLEATNDKKNVEGADNADEMETTAESVSLILKGDKTESELFTGNLSNIVAESNKQGENTVELEGNMLSLLEATNDKKNVEGADNADEMETTAESVSLILKGDKTESELFTGNLSNIVAESNKQGENTVELEGNMLSLLEATNDKKNVEGADNTNEMETTAESVSLILKGDKTESELFTGNLSNIVAESNKQGENTVELEGNMLSLLEATNDKKNVEGADNADEMETTAESVSLILKGDKTESELFTGNLGNIVAESNKQGENTVELEGVQSGIAEEIVAKFEHKKPLSSSSFILHRDDDVQSLVDDITATHKSLVFDKSVSFSDTAEFITNVSNCLGPSDNKVEEIKSLDVSSFTSAILEGFEFKEQEDDALSDSYAQFGKANNNNAKIVFERWGQFIEAVCGEVERRIDLEGTAVSSLANLIDEDPRFYSVLHERLQSNRDGDVTKKSLDNLVQAGQTLIENEWNSWLTTVLESFHGPLTDTQQVYANDSSKLEEALGSIKKLQDNISFMNDAKTKAAKRKNILRQKAIATELEGEIESIESQISTMKSALLKLEHQEKSALKSLSDYQNLHRNIDLHDVLKGEAESSQKNFVSLNGLHSWSMKTICTNDLEFITTGSCPQTNLKMVYEGAKCGKANKNFTSPFHSCDMRAKSLYVYQEPISGFLDTATKLLIETAQQSSGNDAIKIDEHLQKYTWLTGRFDLIAKEFQVVQNRYNGTLRRKSEDLFSFLVRFENKNSTVVADFQIDSTYPSFPIEVRLDLVSGEHDLGVIKKSLVKNANPGFGSLSRACDIIESIMKGHEI